MWTLITLLKPHIFFKFIGQKIFWKFRQSFQIISRMKWGANVWFRRLIKLIGSKDYDKYFETSTWWNFSHRLKIDLDLWSLGIMLISYDHTPGASCVIYQFMRNIWTVFSTKIKTMAVNTCNTGLFWS